MNAGLWGAGQSACLEQEGQPGAAVGQGGSLQYAQFECLWAGAEVQSCAGEALGYPRAPPAPWRSLFITTHTEE